MKEFIIKDHSEDKPFGNPITIICYAILMLLLIGLASLLRA